MKPKPSQLFYKTILLFLLVSLFSSLAIGQNKLILHRGAEKETLLNGKLLGMTLKGEDFKYKDWKKVYKCNSTVLQNVWEIDSIGFDSIYLAGFDYNVTFEPITITRKDIKTLKNKDYLIDTVIPSKTGKSKLDTLVCRIIHLDFTGNKYEAVNYNDIQSFTFARMDIEPSHFTNIYINNPIPFRVYGYHNHGNHFHSDVSGRGGAAIAFLVILSVDLTISLTAAIINDIVDNLNAQVHTYDLNDWNIRVKIKNYGKKDVIRH